jgi:N-acylneuraminate cytidylyltransferase/CMP-N,N'-diacetyllegionaminic acid synthase
LKRVCTICARGGSKGVAGKNLRLLAGKPLVALSVIQAKRSGLFEAVAVSSDSEAILESGREAGADVIVRRPAEMASDTAAKVPAIRHAFLETEKARGATFDVLVDLDCTSPLRLVEDIRGAVELLERTGAPNVITGAAARRSPYFNLVEERPDGSVGLAKPPSRPIVRRQDVPRCFDMNASIYAWTRECILRSEGVFHPETRLFEMPEERSLDIDSEHDWRIVEFLAESGKRFRDVW